MSDEEDGFEPKLKPTAHVIVGRKGYYSEEEWWIVAIYTDEEQAKGEIAKLKTYAELLGKHDEHHDGLRYVLWSAPLRDQEPRHEPNKP